VGLHDEIYQSATCVGGVDARSTYCYLLAAAEARDEHLGLSSLETMEQGLNPEYTIADAAKGLRAGQKAFGIHHVTAICFTSSNSARV